MANQWLDPCADPLQRSRLISGIWAGPYWINSVIGMMLRIKVTFAATQENEHTLAG